MSRDDQPAVRASVAAQAPLELGGLPPDRGFTLVEILISIVLVGVLSAVIVLGISSLTDKGRAAACATSLDAARTGSVAYYSKNSAHPSTMAQMTTSAPPTLELSGGVTLDGSGVRATGNGWTLTMTPGVGGAAPTFACSSGTPVGSAAGTTACPGTYARWVGEYYANTTLSGAPTLCRDDAALSFAWGGGGPGGGVPNDYFSARWTRTVAFSAAGTYTFTIGSDDGSRVRIDGVAVFDWWSAHGYSTRTFQRVLAAGSHTIEVEFYEAAITAQIDLTWS